MQQESNPNSRRERVLNELYQQIEKYHIGAARYMNREFNKQSLQRRRITLIIAGLLVAWLCLFLIADAIVNKSTNGIVVYPIEKSILHNNAQGDSIRKDTRH